MRICNQCQNKVETEVVKEINYPYYCSNCDENKYEFETTIVVSPKEIKEI